MSIEEFELKSDEEESPFQDTIDTIVQDIPALTMERNEKIETISP
jgi:hypothetical protein